MRINDILLELRRYRKNNQLDRYEEELITYELELDVEAIRLDKEHEVKECNKRISEET